MKDDKLETKKDERIILNKEDMKVIISLLEDNDEPNSNLVELMK